MTDNKIPPKRKTVRLNHPNPLFEKWLKEWKDEAAAKHSDTQYAFAKALISLKKYPLPLKSGKECLILENFGTRICLLLDRKLADYKKSNGLGVDDVISGVCDDPDETSEPPKKQTKKPKKVADPNHENPIKAVAKPYIPTLRSSSYAVLVALLQNLKKNGPPGEMQKEELQTASQPLCDTSMFKPLPGSYYSGWSSVGPLVNKGLVQRRGNPHRFSLTPEGITLAEKLPILDLDSSVDGPGPSSSVSVRNNALPSPKKVKVRKKKVCSSTSDNNTNVVQKDPVLEEDVMSNKESLTQTSEDTNNSQEEEVIFPSGSFQVILLVDTQEIHKGDEMVKELRAQGVTLEVRKLKVGDFAWVSRSAEGHELVLPYIIERKRLDDLASSIKDGRFHEQKFRLKQCGVPNLIYLVESHGQRHYSLPTSTLLQAATNTQIIDRFCVKHTENSHETVVYIAMFTKILARKFTDKTLIMCKKNMLPTFKVEDDCISLMSFREFSKFSGKTRKYNVREMFIKQLVQLRGLSVEKALAIVDLYPCPRALITAFMNGGSDKLLADICAGNLNRKIGPVISKAVFDLYSKPVLS